MVNYCKDFPLENYEEFENYGQLTTKQLQEKPDLLQKLMTTESK